MQTDSISVSTKDDIPSLMKLVNSAYRGDEAKQGWTHEADLIAGDLRIDEDALRHHLEEPGAVILKYTDGKKIAGCVYLKKQNRSLYLGMLSVSPKIQGGGIGKKLLAAAEVYARKNDCTKIEMTVISDRAELIAWYKRNGYQVTQERKPFHTEERFGIPRKKLEFMVMEKILL